jgi:hypothetical protein
LKALAPFALALCLTFTVISVFRASEADTVKVSYVNASSQSDITVLACNGEAVICDIGNGSKTSFRKALNEVYEARATEIQAIMLTRYSYAHNAALIDVFSNEKVHSLWIPYPETEKEYNILIPLKQISEKYGVDIFVYESGDSLSIFEFTSITAFRDRIDRSQVPISIISINSRSERIMYFSPAFNELEALPSGVEQMMKKSEYFIFGNKGPVTKTTYGIPAENDARLIVFADDIRAAYFDSEGIINTTMIMSPEKCHIYIKK